MLPRKSNIDQVRLFIQADDATNESKEKRVLLTDIILTVTFPELYATYCGDVKLVLYPLVGIADTLRYKTLIQSKSSSTMFNIYCVTTNFINFINLCDISTTCKTTCSSFENVIYLLIYSTVMIIIDI